MNSVKCGLEKKKYAEEAGYRVLRNEARSAWEYEGSRRSGVWSMHALDRKEGGGLEREVTNKGS
jgi:hypothetical protein